MMEYNWPGNIRELENLVKRYVIVGNEAQITREFSTRKPIINSTNAAASGWSLMGTKSDRDAAPVKPVLFDAIPITAAIDVGSDTPSLLEIGRQAAMLAEREAIGRVLTQTRWNRRQAAKILKISYKALLNKLNCLLYTSPSPRDYAASRMPSSA